MKDVAMKAFERFPYSRKPYDAHSSVFLVRMRSSILRRPGGAPTLVVILSRPQTMVSLKMEVSSLQAD
jgi:hypothetical protein